MVRQLLDHQKLNLSYLQYTDTATAAPIKGEPGIFVMASTATWNAGTDLATPPKPTTAAVLPIAIIAPIVPADTASQGDLKYFQLTINVAIIPPNKATIKADCFNESWKMYEIIRTTNNGIIAKKGFGNGRVTSNVGSVSRSIKRSPLLTALLIIFFNHQYPNTAMNDSYNKTYFPTCILSCL